MTGLSCEGAGLRQEILGEGKENNFSLRKFNYFLSLRLVKIPIIRSILSKI
jgi:hypothetical protein